MITAATSWTVYQNWVDAQDAFAAAQASRAYLRSLNNFQLSLVEVESSQRGYLLTKREDYLETYERDLIEVRRELRNLSNAVISRPESRATVEQILVLAQRKLDEIALTIGQQQLKHHEEALATVMSGHGLLMMKNIRTLCNAELNAQRSGVTKSSDDSQSHQMAAIELSAIGGVLMLSLMGAGFFALTSGASKQALLAESLADAKEVFETTLTSIGDGVISTDHKGVIEFMNPEAAEISGWPRESVVGRHLDEVLRIVNESTREKVESPFVKVMRTAKATVMANHTLLLRQDGSEIAIDDSGAPIRNSHGEIKGVVLVFRGIEERRRAEAALEESHNELLKANEELRQFSYAATHDLQEPLRTIVVFSQLLGRTYRETLDERGQQLLNTIEEAGHRMSSLVSDLLTFTRIGTDSSAARSEVDPAKILAETLIQLKGSIEDTKAEITSDPLHNVSCHPAQLNQLFQNLISNAIKYRKPDEAPRIHISSSSDGRFATFKISDNGIGFRQEYAERIFLIFQRLHGRSIPGTGIGLALCRRIVEKSGGKIWAESQENAGSTFLFMLPLWEQDVARRKQILPQ